MNPASPSLKPISGFFAAIFLSLMAQAEPFFPTLNFSLPKYAFEQSDLEPLVDTCEWVPGPDRMLSEVRESLKKLKPPSEAISKLTSSTSLGAAALEFVLQGRPRQQFNIVLDGLPLFEIDRSDLFVISELTSLNIEGAEVPRLVRRTMFEGREWVLSQRGCRTPACRRLSLGNGHDFSRFRKEPLCRDAICAAERLFGREQGLLTLWLYLKFGILTGPYVSPMADPGGFAPETAWALAMAASTIPSHLRERVFKGSRFYQYRKGETLPMYGTRPIVANGAGQIFDRINSRNFYERVGVLIHELAHRITLGSDLDMSEAWKRTVRRDFVSIYAMSNHEEDFAEAVSLYRLDPKRLRSISPLRYESVRKMVFAGIEYTENRCEGSRP